MLTIWRVRHVRIKRLAARGVRLAWISQSHAYLTNQQISLKLCIQSNFRLL